MRITRFPNIENEAHEYHLRSNNSPWLLKTPVLKSVNYQPHIVELSNEGPRKIEAATEDGSVQLSRDLAPVMVTLEDAIMQRTSSRMFSKSPIAFEKFSKLLALSNGLRESVNSKIKGGRNSPSAGGLGSCEIYMLVFNVEGIKPGLYHYDVAEHALKPLRLGNFKRWTEKMVLIQTELAESGCLLFLASNQKRLLQKYGSRGYRLGLLDAGHVSQNIYLIASALNLAVTATGGFIDDTLNTALRLDGLKDCVVLVLAVGENQ